MPLERERILERLHELARRGDELRLRKREGGLHGEYVADRQGVERWIASCLSVLRLLGEGAPHTARFSEVVARAKESVTLLSYFNTMLGIFKDAAEDVEAGFLGERDLLLTADAFESFLEQADYLLEQGYKDPAAMLAGAVLESTLRKMCEVRSIPTDRQDKIGTLNDKLAKHQKPPAYSSMYHKQIIAWADLRNNADHGHFDEYNHEDVRAMITGVREFAARHLA
jgi:hypothetical protein